jgi:hypothetical protein
VRREAAAGHRRRVDEHEPVLEGAAIHAARDGIASERATQLEPVE